MALVCIAATASAAPPAIAQSSLGVVALVNDAPISRYDLEARLQLTMLFARLRPDLPLPADLSARVLDKLIEEKLQIQAAADNGVVISDRQLDERVAALENANNLPPGGFAQFLQRAGLEEEVLRARLRAAMAWVGVLEQRFAAELTVNDAELETRLQLLQRNSGQLRKRVEEIFLAPDRPDEIPQTRETALLLREHLARGADFGELAQLFSSSPSAFAAGDLGWLLPAEWPRELAAVIAETPPGAMAGPLQTGSGYSLLKITAAEPLGGAVESYLNLRQIRLPLDGAGNGDDTALTRADAIAAATRLRSMFTGCADADMAALQAALPPGGVLTPPLQVKPADLTPEARAQLAPLAAGEISAPLTTPTAVVLLALCDISQQTAAGPDAAMERELLRRGRMQTLSRRYLQELRRTAVIDRRL